MVYNRQRKMIKNKYMFAGLFVFSMVMGFSGIALGQGRIPDMDGPSMDDGIGPVAIGAKVASNTFSAQSVDGQTLYFRIINNGNTVALTFPNDTTSSALRVWNGYAKPTGNLVVPSTVTNNGITYTVVSCDCAFGGCTGLTTVVLPNTITSLGYNMFYGCSSLTSVTLPNGLTSIRSHAFNGCAALTTVDIPSTVEYIYDYAFSWCPLLEVTLPSNLRFIGNSAFYADSSLTSIVIPDSVTTISKWAFGECTYLQMMQMGSSVQVIDTLAFYSTRALTSVLLPESLRKIGIRAFLGSGLTNVTIPNGVALVSDQAFAWCESLATVNWNAERCSIGDSVFVYCAPQATLNIGTDASYISKSGFRNATFTTLNYSARDLRSADVRFYFTWTWNSTTHQRDTIWYYDSVIVDNVNSSNLLLIKDLNISTLTVSESVEHVSAGCFACPSLTTVNWNADSSEATFAHSNSATYGLTPFWYEYSILDDNGDWIGDDTVIAPIATLTFGNNVRTIPEGLAYRLPTLHQITLPSVVEAIGSYAFAYSGLNGEFTIPASVERLGSFSFFGTGLTTINYNAANAKIGSVSRYWDGPGGWVETGWRIVNAPAIGNVANINFGPTVDSIPALLLYGDSALTSLTVPENVRHIAPCAFACPNLDTLNWNARRVANTTYYDRYIFGGTSMDFDYGYVYIPRSQISHLTIGENVEYIPERFLMNDTALTSVVFPLSVKNIGVSAFENTRLTEVTIPESVDSIGGRAFRDVKTLASVTFKPANVVAYSSSFEYSNFSPSDYSGTMVQNLTLGSGVRSIPDYLFSRMNITTLQLPDSLQSLGENSFAYCSQLAAVNVPDMVTTIGNRAFRACTSLQTVRIGDGVTSIGAGSFEDCPITRLTLGESLATIGNGTFSGMTNPDTIFVRATVPPTITSTTFQGMPTNARIMLPCGTLQAYEDAPYWNAFTRMAEPPECGNIVTVVSNNPMMGSVSGGGSYSTGTVATLSAMPKANHGFTGWADGSVDNPRLVLVNGDASYTANFVSISGGVVHDTMTVTVHDTLTITVPVHDTTTITIHDTTIIRDTLFVGDGDTLIVYRDVHDTVYINVPVHDTIIIHDTVYIHDNGVDDVSMIDAKMYSEGGQVVVEGANGYVVTLYDVVGHQLAIRQDIYGQLRFDVPASGTYLVKVGDAPARRVVVLR